MDIGDNNKMTEQDQTQSKKLKIPPVVFIVVAFVILIGIGIATS